MDTRFDFSVQKRLFRLALDVLSIRLSPEDIWAFGGGTALSAVHFHHRYSDDIDIFLYDGNISRLVPGRWFPENLIARLQGEGFLGHKYPKTYVELEFPVGKIQFFDVTPKTEAPFTIETIWGEAVRIETPAEIIAKKVFWNSPQLRPRDIFDIAVAVSQRPKILEDLIIQEGMSIDLFIDLCEFLKNNKNFKKTYQIEMENLKIAEKYSNLAASSIDFVINSLHQSFREIGRIGNPNRVESAKERPRRRTTKTYPSS